jgi:hypothetical protein
MMRTGQGARSPDSGAIPELSAGSAGGLALPHRARAVFAWERATRYRVASRFRTPFAASARLESNGLLHALTAGAGVEDHEGQPQQPHRRRFGDDGEIIHVHRQVQGLPYVTMNQVRPVQLCYVMANDLI